MFKVRIPPTGRTCLDQTRKTSQPSLAATSRRTPSQSHLSSSPQAHRSLTPTSSEISTTSSGHLGDLIATQTPPPPSPSRAVAHVSEGRYVRPSPLPRCWPATVILSHPTDSHTRISDKSHYSNCHLHCISGGSMVGRFLHWLTKTTCSTLRQCRSEKPPLVYSDWEIYFMASGPAVALQAHGHFPSPGE
ncbi:hypothetical protein CGRA01v4_11519 [Colletotrichum graminicola]|nr:hypothetical protein CGRA01v4_11519 [Colletotrichum graminicola]